MHGKPRSRELSQAELGDDALTELTEPQLARRIATSSAAQRAAITELYRRFWPRLRSFGLRHLRDDEAARELAQRVLLLTVDKLRAGEVHEPERIASFILSTARWSLHSQRRDERRFEPIDQERFGEGNHAVTGDMPTAAAQESLVNREWIRGCLESLAERERSVIVLTFFQGCTAQEIAEATGLSPGNVRVVRHRALGLLRHCLGEAHERASRQHGTEEKEQGR